MKPERRFITGWGTEKSLGNEDAAETSDLKNPWGRNGGVGCLGRKRDSDDKDEELGVDSVETHEIAEVFATGVGGFVTAGQDLGEGEGVGPDTCLLGAETS